MEKNQYQMQADISLKDLLLKLQQIFLYVISKWKIIIVFVIAGAIFGYITSKFSTTKYRAVYSFALEGENVGFPGAMGLASQFGLSLDGGSTASAFSGDNLMELMKSRTLVLEAMLGPLKFDQNKLSLLEYYIDFNKLRTGWDSNPKLKGVNFPVNADLLSFTREQDSIFNNIHQVIIRDILSVAKVDKKLSFIKVEVKSTDEVFAKYFSEAIVDEVSQFYIDTKTKKSLENVSILQRQTDSIRTGLNRALSGVAVTTENLVNMNPSRQILKIPSQQKQIDVQTNTVILSELVKNLELAKLTLRKETPLVQVIDRPVFPLAKERLNTLSAIFTGAFLAGLVITIFFIFQNLWLNLFN